MPQVRNNDYRDAEGLVDWEALRQAQISNGEICEKCGAYIFPLYSEEYGSPLLCPNCQALTQSVNEVEHPRLIRCPQCKHMYKVAGNDLYELYEEGEHWETCPECGCDFKVTTRVEYFFTSPALETNEEVSK